ncbi:MAG: hypothetical protein AAFS10_03560, partial [Myxococcota bacterium]
TCLAHRIDEEGWAYDPNVRTGARDRRDFQGFIEINRTGVYRFYMKGHKTSLTVAGEQLFINGVQQHGIVPRVRDIALSAGYHPIAFEMGSQDKLEWEGPGLERQYVDPEKLFIPGE